MLIRNATVVTMNESRQVIPRGDVLIVGERIARVGPAGVVPDIEAAAHEIMDAAGRVVIPGLVQSHVHLCQTLFRNQADDLALLQWLRERIWPFEAAHDAASLAASADLGIAELLRGGTTAVLDMGTVRHTEAIFESARRAGIRATIGKCHMDVDAGQPAPLRESARESREEALALMERWHDAEGGRLRYAFAPRFVLSCSEALLRDIAAIAREKRVRVHTHASENAEECRIVREQVGRDNIDYLLAIGLGGENLCLAHCVHATDGELDLMAREAVKVLHCPSSNLKLGSGIARVPEMLDRGISVSIGADGAPCNNNLDAFVEMRLAALLQKPRLGPRAMPALRVLELMTIEGARALGLGEEIGAIEPGRRADLVVLDLDDVATVPGTDLFARIVYAAQSRHVTDVWVDGRAVVRARTLTTLDEERVRARAWEERARLEKRLARP
jgi:cytosine/adenosine deaminase-related metal-dependent hydrolase